MDTFNSVCIYENPFGVSVHAVKEMLGNTAVVGRQYMIKAPKQSQFIHFHAGPLEKGNMNGITNEGVIAILLHRLEQLQTEIPCDENRAAMEHLQAALTALETRKQRRPQIS